MLKKIASWILRDHLSALREGSRAFEEQLRQVGNSWRERYDAKAREVDVVRHQLGGLETEMGLVQEQRNRAWADNTGLRKLHGSHRMHIRALQKQLEAGRATVAGLRGKRADLEQAVGMLIHERDTARAELAEAKKARARRAPKKEAA